MCRHSHIDMFWLKVLGSCGVLKCEKKEKCGNIFLTRLANGLESVI